MEISAISRGIGKEITYTQHGLKRGRDSSSSTLWPQTRNYYVEQPCCFTIGTYAHHAINQGNGESHFSLA